MLKRLGTSALAVLACVLLVQTPAHTFAATSAGGVNHTDPLAGNCYLALSSVAPRVFEMDFGRSNDFKTNFCTAPGGYTFGEEFLVFTLWNSDCSVNQDPVNFDGVAIASAVLLFRTSGELETSGLAFRVPCGVLP